MPRGVSDRRQGAYSEEQSRPGRRALGTRTNPAAARAARDDGVGLHQSRHAPQREGTLTADEVYSLTAYLLFINDVIKEDEVLDAKTLPMVKMPIGTDYASLPEWKPRTVRLKGYPH
jgi:hypothetical protein